MSQPELILIAAVARNGVIGRDNALPWRLKADLAHFKRCTMGSPILMGRKTWESLGRPLPGRRHLVLSRDPGYRAEGLEVFTSPEAAIAAVADSPCLFVIGGAEIYRQMLPFADRLLLTEVDATPEGDARFPALPAGVFIEVERESHPADADNDHAYAFVSYRRQPAR